MWGTQIYAPNAMIKAHKVLKYLSPKSHQTTNAMEEYQRKNKGGEHKELQDLDPQGSPHLEERWIGGNVDLDFLLFFLKRIQKSWEE